jgi:hypothetical protein
MEGLRVLDAARAHRRVAHVTDAHEALERGGLLVGEDVAHEALGLVVMEAAVVGQRPGRVLPAVLDGQQAGVDLREDLGASRREDANEAAHRGWAF